MSGADWRPTASLETLRARAAMLAYVRGFFGGRGVLEVETPALSRAAITDPNLASLCTGIRGGRRMYLQTSPEFAMKRLLAAGCPDIFQVCKVFRDGESGRLHNPEFTLLEWYRTGFDLHGLMREVAQLLEGLLAVSPGLASEATYISYRDLYLAHLGLDPLETAAPALAAALAALGVALPDGPSDKDELLDLGMAALIVPALPPEVLTFIFDYPASQASLALIAPDDQRVARRFEAVLGGMELCNGFEELRDADQQRLRFERERKRRLLNGLPDVPIDERLLAALAAGLPACSGVALGLDRVLMLAVAAEHIDEVLAFPVGRA